MDNLTKYKKEAVYINNDNQPHVQRQKLVIHNQDAERRGGVYKITKLIWLAVGVLNMLVAFRFILKLIGANPANMFPEFDL